MRPPRNPFRLRSAERIEDAGQFLALCEPGLLELLPAGELWDRRVIVRSSAGGGKTTLLRVFTPASLRVLAARGAKDDQTGELHRALGARGVLTRRGPAVAGVLLSLAGKYQPLDQLTSIDPAQRLRAFMALLDARILLGSLKAHLELAGLRYPDHLARIEIAASGAEVASALVGTHGPEIHAWARQLEGQVATALSSLAPASEHPLPGGDELASLERLGADSVRIDGMRVAARTAILLDDVHRLSSAQRHLLVDTLLARRAPTPVWVAERREALTPEELLSLEARDERDRVVVDIEQYWRGARRQSFLRLVNGVADRRTVLASDAPSSSFATLLDGQDEAAWEAVLPKVEQRLLAAAEGRREFAGWIEARVASEATARERAIAMRSLEIRIARELAASQMTLDLLVRDEAALEDFERRRREANNLREAAELLLCSEFDLPYYCGAERLAQLAFANVDQFLDFSGDLFEELASATVLRRRARLSAQRQQQLIDAAVRRLWRELAGGVRDGGRIRALLDGVGEYCAQHTYLPNAPYAPGVTGVALRRSQAEQLQAAAAGDPESWQGQLGRMLAALVAHNHVMVQSSEAKGQRWAVYYLNRAWCVRYRLPFGYGGWQPTSPDQLWGWSQGDQVRAPQRLAA